MSSKPHKPAPLEAGLLQAARALDTQISRRMQRSPEEREVHGVQKWEPIQEKVEEVASIIIEQFGEDQVQLDSILVLAQAYSKALFILASELGEEGLGDMRSRYCREAFTALIRDAERGVGVLTEAGAALN